MTQGTKASHLSFQLTSHKLNGKNYLEWSQFVKLAIDGRGKLGHLNGEVEQPQVGDPKISEWRQGEKEVTFYYNEMMSLWQELDQCYNDEWECPEDGVKAMKKEENERAYLFLAGLNKEFYEVRSRILGKKSLPKLRKIFSEDMLSGRMIGNDKEFGGIYFLKDEHLSQPTTTLC
ncbi:hypothetical protein PVK06_024596 [Gossypium arboreum]|uniref:Retrotransposon Copia-like N-terminal domain-containing protein n=1 Tax=Gossypium arboreum TaxID=29729 RepID=A0ABR0PED0_GOSAR|nr:hypothetical protein PVK06_024596 [Gossypium arboreum]